MEKYYTPAIEEFHVGFEFEVNTAKEENDGRYWFPAKISSDVLSEGTDLIDLPSNVRVKYLDRKDIESLGWKPTIITDGHTNWTVFEKQPTADLSIYLEIKNGTVKIWTNDLFKNLFSGIIQNKSELKKLMQQLNIQ